MLNREYDAAHMLSPMPIAINMGIGSVAQPINVATIQNINGQAITLALKHKDKCDPKQWKGMIFAVPSNTRCTTSCSAITWPKRGSTPNATSRSASRRHRR